MNPTRRSIALAALAACAGPLAAQTQNYPSKPIRLVVPFVPGGGADTVARFISTQLQQRTGQPAVVENKPGAGGALAALQVARSQADGYTLLVVSNTFVTTPAISRANYDPMRDFTPVTTIGTSPYVVLVNPESEYRTLADLVRAGKERPDRLRFGSAGQGGVTHLLGELLKQRGQFQALHIPYKGTAAALVDLLGQQIEFAFADTASAISHVRSGKLRALAITSPARSPLLPEVPTTTEAGVKLEVVGFYGLMAPAQLPAPVLAKLNAIMADVLASAEIKDRFASSLTDPHHLPADRFASMLGSEVELWRNVVKNSGSKFD